MNEEKKLGDSEHRYEESSEVDRWKAQYDALMAELENLDPENDIHAERENVFPSNVPEGIENKRASPRYTFPDTEGAQIFAHLGPKAFRIIDISVGGVAFFSDVAFEPGTNLLLSALGMVALDVEVLDCELYETDPEFMEFMYRIRAQFSPRVNGYLVYVLSREMYLKQMAGIMGEGNHPTGVVEKK